MIVIREILESATTIATVGASKDRSKPAGEVPRYLKQIGFRVIPVNPNAIELYGAKAYPSLLDIGEPVDVVQVFRPADEAPEIARQAAQIGAKVLWLQLGIRSDDARRIAEEAGLAYVENRCMAVETRRLGIAKTRAA
jgi:predicted CoA-binding protein